MTLNTNGYNEALELAHKLTQNPQESEIIRNEEFCIAVLDKLIDWNVEYKCHFCHNKDGFYYMVSIK